MMENGLLGLIYGGWVYVLPKVLKKGTKQKGVYIGRPSKWGNPFKDGTREENIARFEEWFRSQPELMKEAQRELYGKNLICFCSPLPCHGDVILKVVYESDPRGIIKE